MTADDYAAMSWHARQTLNTRLRAETRKLRAQLTVIRADLTKAGEPPPDVAAILADTKAQLAALPTDPDAAAHRLAIWQELRHRKDTE